MSVCPRSRAPALLVVSVSRAVLECTGWGNGGGGAAGGVCGAAA